MPTHAVRVAIPLALAVAFVVLIVQLHWSGFLDSDDAFYAAGAMGWVQHFPFLGTTHWALRHVIVMPMALLFLVFGETETTLIIPSLGYVIGIVVLLFIVARRLDGNLAGALAVAIGGAIPIIASGASSVSTDVPSTFWIFASIWAFHCSWERRSRSLLVWSGIYAGCAYITRETTIALIILYGLLFLFNYGGRRTAFLWLGLGFFVVAFADWIYLTWMSGDPLYRLHIALKGVAADNPDHPAAFATEPGMDRFGALAAPWWIKPFIVNFLNQNFGLFFWFAVPATVWLATSAKASEAKRVARLFGGLALVWFITLGYVLTPWLWVIGRYFMVAAVLLTVPLSLVLIQLLRHRRQVVAWTVLVALLLSDAALAAAENHNLFFGERTLVAVARQSPETVFTDPSTAAGARWLLATEGLSDRVRVGIPQPGSLFLLNSRPRRPNQPDWPIRSAGAGWVELASFATPQKWTSFIVRWQAVRRLLPEGLVQKLDPPAQTVRVYRVPKA